jgi:hypothetical protein
VRVKRKAPGARATAKPQERGARTWPAGAWRWFPTADRRILLLSIALQLVLGLLLGHANDTRIFMSAGYLVGTGHSPYTPHDLSAIFHHPAFTESSTVGYPPPWPLVLGLIYLAVSTLSHDFLLYNLAIKLPVIAATIGLAYLVAAILQNLGSTPAVARRAWVFVLLNPFMLYFGSAWGQIDVIVAVLSLAALTLLYAQHRDASAGLLALAVATKPIALPIVLAAAVYLLSKSLRRAARYLVLCLAGVLILYLVPFFVFGWRLDPAFGHWNSLVLKSGTLSYMTFLRLWRDPFPVPHDWWWLLGFAWVAALAAATLAMRRGDGSFTDLLKKSTGLVLVFFLTRTWLSEPNVTLLVPLVLLLTAIGALDRRALTIVWALPLAFTLFGWTELQLLFPAFPGAMTRALTVVPHLHSLTVVVRAVLVVAWQIAGWWIVVSCFRRGPAAEATIEAEPAASELRGLV